MKFDQPTLITITAPTCSGKSFLLNELTKSLCTRIVSTTTRAPRLEEVEGVDYFFISEAQSLQMEKGDKFAELITFRGTRYGVTKTEMESKMMAARPPIVILEPAGLAIYEDYCRKNSWNIFKTYVYTEEAVRIQRLNDRTFVDVLGASYDHSGWTGHPPTSSTVRQAIARHTDRLLSITGDERTWQAQARWDLLVPGDNLEKAVADMKQQVAWVNRKNAEPKPHTI